MKIEPITLTIDGEPVECHIRKLKYRERMSIAGILKRAPAEPGDEDTDAKPRFVRGSVGEYQVAVITTSLCNEAGKPFFTADEVDEWTNEDVAAVLARVEEFNKDQADAVEAARGNSEATGDEGTSSS